MAYRPKNVDAASISGLTPKQVVYGASDGSLDQEAGFEYDESTNVEHVDIHRTETEPVFNVKHPTYGAIGDGTTDDAAAIQAAIDAVPLAGGVVYIPVGVYKLGTALTIAKSRVTIRGDGQEITILRQNAATIDGIHVGDGVTRWEHIRVERLSIDSPSVTKTAGAGILFDTVTRVEVVDVRIDDQFKGISYDDTIIGMFENIQLGEIATGGVVIDCFGGDEASLTMRSVTYNGSTVPAAGVRIRQGSTFMFDQIQFINCDYGLLLQPDATKSVVSVQVEQSFFDNCDIDAIKFDAASGTTIARITVEDTWCQSTQSGVHFAGAGAISGIIFHGMTVILNGRHGFHIESGVNFEITGCGIAANSASASNTYDGISIAANITDFRIFNNRIGPWHDATASQRNGILIAAGTTNNYVMIGNDCRSNVSSGISDGGTGTVKWVAYNLIGVASQAVEATLTNSVTSGGTDNTISNVVAAPVDTNAASLVSTRNAIYQLARKVRLLELQAKISGWATT